MVDSLFKAECNCLGVWVRKIQNFIVLTIFWWTKLAVHEDGDCKDINYKSMNFSWYHYLIEFLDNGKNSYLRHVGMVVVESSFEAEQNAFDIWKKKIKDMSILKGLCLIFVLVTSYG